MDMEEAATELGKLMDQVRTKKSTAFLQQSCRCHARCTDDEALSTFHTALTLDT